MALVKPDSARIAKIKVIGIRPGEKLHESLTTIEESPLIREMKDRYIVLSASREWEVDQSLYTRYKKVKEGFEYNSYDNKEYISAKKMTKILEELGV